MLWISTAVFVVVVALLVAAVVRGRRRRDDSLDRDRPAWGGRFIVVAGVFVPALILAAVYVFSLVKMDALVDAGARPSMEIQVIGHDWWWEARYPNGAVTANEIHIPAGEPVRVRLTTADVIHSFWVPELQVKTDQIPGRENVTWLQADEPGRYRGQCAEFCGLQHANMVFYVVAEDPATFAQWVENEASPSLPTGSEGESIFLSSSCAGCHTIRGTTASGTLGPDLTHLARRKTIAGVLANTRANLTRFVADPHASKPGVSMPPTELTGEEVQAVVDYLQGLD